MANSQAICNSFKVDLLNGKHAFGTTVTRGSTSADVFKGALYLVSGTLGSGTTVYSSSNEVTSTNYTAGGQTLSANAPILSSNTACWTPTSSLVWTNVTLTSFDSLLVYNASQANATVAVFTFGSQALTAGNFTLTMPANAAGTALLQIQ